MGDLDKDTAVTALDDGRYRARLSDEWAIWGPNGGYVVAVALRAAGLATGRERPVSISAHLLSVAAFDEVELTTTVLRRSRFATSVRVSLAQGDQPVVEALVWGIDGGAVELHHEIATMPDIPPPGSTPSYDERVAELGDEAGPQFAFWDNVEHQPLVWQDPWPPLHAVEPSALWWMRFRPTPTFDDPWVDAARLLIPIDTMGWPAAHLGYAHDDPPIIAPTIDVSARFHQPATGDEWLLAEAVSPVAAGGVVNAVGRVWNERGQLLASGAQSMLCRPVPPQG
jgi:acyl-CoA thioesterase